jgi:hypothetical protein
VPIVLMSAKGDKIRGSFVRQAGAVDAITKPFDSRALIAVIEGALRKSQEEEIVDLSDEVEVEDDVDPNAPPAVSLSTDPAERRAQIRVAIAERLARWLEPLRSEGKIAPNPADLEQTLDEHRLVELERWLAGYGGDVADALSGDLSFISIAEVLQMLELQRQSGRLSIVGGGGEIQIFMSDGAIDLVQSIGLAVSFRLGRYLVEDGIISRDALKQQLSETESTDRLLGESLVEAQAASREQVQKALSRQSGELIYELVRWKEGRFAFVTGATSTPSSLANLGMTPGGLLMEGFRRVDEWRLIEGSFDFDEILFRDKKASERSHSSDLTTVEVAVLDAVDGVLTVREILERVDASTFDVCKILYQFLNSRLVRRKAA